MHEYAAEIAVSVDMTGIDLKRPPIAGHGLIELTQVVQNIAEVVVHIGKIGFDLQSAAITLNGEIDLPQIAQGVAEIAVRDGEFGVERQRPAVGANRLVELPEAAQSGAEIAVCLCVIGQKLGCPVQGLPGVLSLSLQGLPQRLPENPRIWMLRDQRARSAFHLHIASGAGKEAQLLDVGRRRIVSAHAAHLSNKREVATAPIKKASNPCGSEAISLDRSSFLFGCFCVPRRYCVVRIAD